MEARVKIANAYDAFWFLTEHPKFKCREAILVKDKATHKLSKGSRFRWLPDKMPWNKGKKYLIEEFRYDIDSLSVNLDIYWAKVDKNGKATEGASIPECWLEFGQLKYEIYDGGLRRSNYHDVRLDCGAATFDKALVKLARLVKRHYGDYEVK